MKLRVALFIGLLLILLAGGLGFFLIKGNLDQVATRNAKATVTAQAIRASIVEANATATAATTNPYPPHGGVLLLNAPLHENTKNPAWDEGTTPNLGFCEFTGGAYHIEVAQMNAFYYCSAKSLVLSNFAYQVQMTIIKGDHGGISFRSPAGGSLYYFYIDTRGNYELDLNKDHNFVRTISSGFSSAIRTGYNQSNFIAVVAQGNSFDLYVNLQHVAHTTDATFSSGQVGVLVIDNGHSTEAAFSNVKVWTL